MFFIKLVLGPELYNNLEYLPFSKNPIILGPPAAYAFSKNEKHQSKLQSNTFFTLWI